MTPHLTWTDLVGLGLTARPQAGSADAAPGWRARVSARFFAARYDREVDAGVSAEPGSALAVHLTRLSAVRERDELARALRVAFRDAVEGADALRPRVPVRTQPVLGASDIIAAILSRLDAPGQVRVRGIARLRMLLSDGRGPLYRTGSGSLNAALRGVHAAL